jgi:hypothetical protein
VAVIPTKLHANPATAGPNGMLPWVPPIGAIAACMLVGLVWLKRRRDSAAF